MAKYVFKAKNGKGELVEGFREAASERDALALLRGEGLIVFQVQESVVEETRAAAKPVARQGKGSGGSIRPQDIAVFCRQLSALINSGISILDGIDDLSTMMSNARFSRVLKTIAADIRAGSTLSDAMKRHQKVFGRIFIAMVGVGEKTGKLGTVLTEMSQYLEHAVQLRRKVQAASAYPLFIAAFFVVATGIIVLFLIPKFKAMFASFGASLPVPTKIAFAISDAVVYNIHWVVLLTIGAVTGIVMTYRTQQGRLMADTWILRVPFLGDVVAKVMFARFFQTMATLLRSGIDLVVSLEIAARVLNNGYLEGIIATVRARVIEGTTLAAAFERYPIFPRMAVRMTAVGEKSGRLDEMFLKLSGYYGDEVDGIVASMSSLIEPLLILVVGVVVGVFILVMYLPIFKLAGAMMSGGY